MSLKKYTTVGRQLRLLSTNYKLFGVGAIVGGFVPVAVFVLSNHLGGPEHDLVSAFLVKEKLLNNSIIAALILAGCVFSAKSVYGWGASAFVHDRWKAVGFCVLIEGVMVFSPVELLHWLAGTFLLAINAIATGSNLIIEDADEITCQPGSNGATPETPQAVNLVEPGETPQAVNLVEPLRLESVEIIAPRKRGPAPALKELALRLLMQKADVSEIAEQTGVPRATLYAWRKSLDSPAPLRRGARRA
jgi:hypothetical protein